MYCLKLKITDRVDKHDLKGTKKMLAQSMFGILKVLQSFGKF